MSSFALVPNAKVEPVKIVVQQYGAFTVRPLTEGVVEVRSIDGLLVDSLLYPFSGRMLKHNERWHFGADAVLAPKLSPKRKQEALERITHHINAYMEEHPDFLEVLKIQAWQARLTALDSSIQRAEQDVAWAHRQVADYQRRCAEQEQQVKQFQQQRDALLAQAPAGVDVTPPEPEVVSGEVVASEI
jgi:hypothetical protein